MAKEKAEVEASLEGADQVVQKVGLIESAFQLAGKAIDSNVGGALKSVGSGLVSIAAGGIRAAGIFQTIDLGKGVDSVKTLDKLTAQLGQTSGVSAGQLKSLFETTEKRGGASAVALAQVARSIASVTYDSKDATESVGALADVAQSLGRDVQDEIPLGIALRNAGITAKELPGELGKIVDIATRLKTVGGPQALLDTVAALDDQLAHVAKEGDGVNRTIALIATATKGLSPQKAKEVGAQLLDDLRANAPAVERTIGRKILDENGDLKDPAQVYADLAKRRQSLHGSADAQRRVLINSYGPALGTALQRTSFADVDNLNSLAKDSGAVGAGAQAYRNTDAGKRDVAAIERLAAERNLANPLQRVGDAVNQSSPYASTALGLVKDGVKVGVGGYIAKNGVLNTARAAGSAVAGAGAGTLALAGAAALLPGDTQTPDSVRKEYQDALDSRRKELAELQAGRSPTGIGYRLNHLFSADSPEQAQGDIDKYQRKIAQIDQGRGNADVVAALGALPDKIADAVANKTLKTADQKPRDYTADRGN